MLAPARVLRFTAALAAIGLAAAAIGGCQTSWKEVHRDETFKPTEARPVRVALLPFADETGGVSPFLYPVMPFIWLANLATLHLPESAPDTEKGARLLSQLLEARLRATPVNVLGPVEVESRLRADPGAPPLSSLDPKEIGERLEVDAVLTGTLTSWSTRYYVVESRTVVEANLRLVSTRDGAEWLRARIGVADGAGVAEGPLHLSWIGYALEPLSALGKGPFRDLAIEWAQSAGDAIENAPESSGPPPTLATAQIVNAPAGGWRPGGEIVVEARGTAGCDATFDLATLHRRIPMPRVDDAADDSGALALYRGRYVVAEGDRLVEGPVTVTLSRGGARATKLADHGPVSIAP